MRAGARHRVSWLHLKQQSQSLCSVSRLQCRRLFHRPVKPPLDEFRGAERADLQALLQFYDRPSFGWGDAYQIDRLKPGGEWNVRARKDRPNSDGELPAALTTSAGPAGMRLGDFFRPAMRANRAFRPPCGFEK